ncbi:hypothetical protein C2E23DRAFT_458630 [Lenzites betulinus]|nr:hypothetical protein C2E23DRAFT_458630 [Lenzites betulinus]
MQVYCSTAIQSSRDVWGRCLRFEDGGGGRDDWKQPSGDGVMARFEGVGGGMGWRSNGGVGGTTDLNDATSTEHDRGDAVDAAEITRWYTGIIKKGREGARDT